MVDNRGRAAFDIYGFKIVVEENPELLRLFDFHYSAFRSPVVPDIPSLSIMAREDDLPLRTKGSRYGFSIDFADSVIQLVYHPRIDPAFVLNFADFLMNWPDKCKVHASGVSRQGNGYVFMAPQDTGKTSTALHLLKSGFSFLADDWLIAGSKGIAYPYPKPIRVYDYNLAFDPRWSREIYGNVRGSIVTNVMKMRISLKRVVIPRLPHRLLRYGFNAALSSPVTELPITALAKRFPVSKPCRIAHTFWLEKTPGISEIKFEEISDRSDIIDKAISIYMHEWNDYYRLYYLMASKGVLIDEVENRKQHMRDMLKTVLSDVPLTCIRIPMNTKPLITAEKVLEFIRRA